MFLSLIMIQIKNNLTDDTFVPWFCEDVPSIFDQTEENIYLSSSTPSHSNRPLRTPKMPTKFNHYIVEGKYKYWVEKFVNYSSLDTETKCFVYNLNKTLQPQTYHEACNDPNWIKEMNEEMKALYRNNTQDITELPGIRKLLVAGGFIK